MPWVRCTLWVKWSSARKLCPLWKASIVNHLYWCAASTPDGNDDMIQVKWKSVLNPIQNEHGHEDELFRSCQHRSHDQQVRKNIWIAKSTCTSMVVHVTSTKTMSDIVCCHWPPTFIWICIAMVESVCKFVCVCVCVHCYPCGIICLNYDRRKKMLMQIMTNSAQCWNTK